MRIVLAILLLAACASADVTVHEATDYVFGHYTGDFKSPPHADGNPKRALIVSWSDKPYRFVFSHEASYCPWLEFPSGAAVSFQFFEGNDGWAELFNQYGRLEKNSFVEIIENTPQRIQIRWTYFGVNLKDGDRAYLAREDFFIYANGSILRRQSYKSWMPGDPRGYAREPIELIGLAPVGKTWRDVLPEDGHALTVIDAFSPVHYEVFWSADGKHKRTGDDWKLLDDARGVALILPTREGLAFTAFGDASNFDHTTTRIKEHTHKDTGGIGWGAQSWDHWPIGWIDSQGHEVTPESSKLYPSHFSPAGMDFFALPNEQVEGRDFWSLIGVAQTTQDIRTRTRRWLEGNIKKFENPPPALGPQAR